jgi:hypothetical protein
LIRGNDAKFTATFDTAFTAIDARIIKTPLRHRGPTRSPKGRCLVLGMPGRLAIAGRLS